MALLTRSALRNLFKKGAVPTEINFANLIESTINKLDDGISQSTEHGFMLAPQGPDERLISFFESIRDSDASFSLSLSSNAFGKGLSVNNEENESLLYFKDNGNIGIQNTNPKYTLDVNGMVGMNGRVGTYASGQVHANGEWQIILNDLEGVNAFEIIAQVSGVEGKGRYGLTHAIALGNFGHGKIQQIRSTYGRYAGLGNLFDRISFRWGGTEHNYNLQVKTGNNYGSLDEDGLEKIQINYYISKLWDHNMVK